MERLVGKHAVVTGGGQGIGAAIAERFASEGANVTIAELNDEIGTATAKRLCQSMGPRIRHIGTDIADPDSIASMHEQAVAAFGTVDVLVNNAGINVFREPLESTQADWQLCMSIDLEGAWQCCRQVLPDMLRQEKGAIVNIASNHAFSIMKSTFPYPVAKHALLGLTRSLALEYADRGIAVNAISPGYVDTPIVDNYLAGMDDPVAARAQVEASQPVGRLCQPSEVAAVATLLASDEARFIIGENIVIDGGVAIRMYQ
ncbi:SDR family oxidoreductase [Granulosicoccus sp. 3-233]|uniref:SDR family oxidoreductase n=1 Tax=Granulosicoccus sp. 3-233 TaxID=3417969 RepID=UPI003D3552CE